MDTGLFAPGSAPGAYFLQTRGLKYKLQHIQNSFHHIFSPFCNLAD